jgi:cytochrome c peroxidase
VGATEIVVAAAGFCFLLGCRGEPGAALESRAEPNRPGAVPVGSTQPQRADSASEPIAPLPPAPRENPTLVAVGAELFASRVLSEDGQVSCKSCHDPTHGFADSQSVSRPAGRSPMAKNTPTLLNVVHLQVFNWDGRFGTLEDHIDALIQNPMVHGSTWDALAARLRRGERWREEFARAFPDGITAANAKAALLAFERSLVSPGAPFDRWLLGEKDAISSRAAEGYALFKSRGCVSCHQGALVGGNLFQRLGIIKPYYDASAAHDQGDLGRFDVTGKPEDKHVFRVPSLRNVGLTAPYLHDGSLPTLPLAVGVMATYQLGRSLDRDQIGKIVAFLETLSGQPPDVEPFGVRPRDDQRLDEQP